MLRLITATDTLLRDAKAKAARVFKNTDGATAIEYGLIAAGIAVAIIAAVFALGDDIKNFFTGVSKQMQTKAPS
jgi:pilus assembly protein Flp/PilA